MKVFYTILILIFGLGITNSYSQVLSDSNKTEKKYYLVVKNDGSEYYGYIIKDDGREINDPRQRILVKFSLINRIYKN